MGEDPLGADHAGRFATIHLAWRAGHLGPEAEAAIITREQIAELVARLALDTPDAIVDRLWAIAGRHLRPIHRKLLGSDLPATKKLMVELPSAVAQLENLLERVPPVTRDFMRTSFERLPQSCRNCEALELDALERMLPDLAHTAFFVAGQFERDRKRPVHVLRRQTLKDAAETIERATGNAVQRTWSEKDRKKHTFKGVEGEVLRDFMRLVVAELCTRYRVDRLLIEHASSGLQLIQMLRPPPQGVPFPIACKPEGPKEVRFYAQASRIQAGEVVLPEAAPRLPEFVSEIAAFPGGRFDDQADALGQLLRHGAPAEEPSSNAGPTLFCDGEWIGSDAVATDGPYIEDPWGA